jgi:hypothetical protein
MRRREADACSFVLLSWLAMKLQRRRSLQAPRLRFKTLDLRKQARRMQELESQQIMQPRLTSMLPLQPLRLTKTKMQCRRW